MSLKVLALLDTDFEKKNECKCCMNFRGLTLCIKMDVVFLFFRLILLQKVDDDDDHRKGFLFKSGIFLFASSSWRMAKGSRSFWHTAHLEKRQKNI